VPSLQQLYSIEEEFEPAFLKVIEAAVTDEKRDGIDRVFREFCDLEKKTPYIELILTDLKPDPEAAPIVAGDGIEYYYRWQAILIIRYCTARGKNSDAQGEVVGWLRARTMSILGNQASDFDLPYHEVVQIMPGVTPRTHDPEFAIDASELQMPIVIEIKREFLT
jgi:hypothetical protein